MSIHHQKKMKSMTERGLVMRNKEGKLILTSKGSWEKLNLKVTRSIGNPPVFIKSTTKSPKVKSVVFLCFEGNVASALLMHNTAKKLTRHIDSGGELPVSLSLKTSGTNLLNNPEELKKLSRADLIVYAHPAIKKITEKTRPTKKWQKEIVIEGFDMRETGPEHAFKEILDHIRKKP